ncbi:LuxR C-terminal-related transcriptional regulator [Naumannella huperziae]
MTQTSARTRLNETLDAAGSRQLIMVIAPAAFGKTAMIEGWLAARPEVAERVVRWERGAELRAGAAAVGNGDRPPPLVVADGTIGPDPDEIAGLIAAVADGGGQLLITLRGRPQLDLGTLVVRNDAIEIGAGELALTLAEAGELLRGPNPEIADEAVAGLWAHTFGWPGLLGIVRGHRHWDSRSQLHALFDDFVHSEVLAGLPADVDRTLTAVCTLDEVSPDVARAFTEDPAAFAILSTLPRHGVPITIEASGALRVAPVVLAALRRRLAAEEPERLAELQRRSARRLAKLRRPEAAVGMAIDAGEHELAADLMRSASVRQLYRLGAEHSPMLERLEGSGVMSAGEATLLRSLVLARRRPVDPDALRRTIERHGVDAAWEPLLVALRWLLLRRTGYGDDGSTVELEDQTTRLLREEGIRPEHLAFLQLEYGAFLTAVGRLRAARGMLRLAVTTARLESLPWAVVRATASLAWVDAVRFGSNAARVTAERAEQAAGADPVLRELLAPAHGARALLAIDRLDATEARHWLARAERLELREDPANRAHIAGWVEMIDGRLDTALTLIDEARTAGLGRATAYQRARLAMTALLAAAGAGDLDRADRELETLRELDPEPEAMSVDGLAAGLLMLRGEVEQAHAIFLRAAEIAAPAKDKLALWLLSALVQSADAMQDYRLAVDTFDRAQQLAEQLGLEAAPGRHRAVTSFTHRIRLTPAETHVLANLADGETLTRAAERLFISPNTLKTHLKRIYRKLDVTGRDEAVRRARLMRLI